jgi:hypothetical protein
LLFESLIAFLFASVYCALHSNNLSFILTKRYLCCTSKHTTMVSYPYAANSQNSCITSSVSNGVGLELAEGRGRPTVS